jgi:hypothetical protein
MSQLINNIPNVNPTQSWLNEQLRRAYQDQLLYGQSIMYVNPNNDPEPSITRIDPRTAITGSHPSNIVMDEVGNLPEYITNIYTVSTNNIPYGSGDSSWNTGNSTSYTNLTQESIVEFMRSFSNQQNYNREYVMMTGTGGYTNFQEAMRNAATTGVAYYKHNRIEYDNYDNQIEIIEIDGKREFQIIVTYSSVIKQLTARCNKELTKEEFEKIISDCKKGFYYPVNNFKWEIINK